MSWTIENVNVENGQPAVGRRDGFTLIELLLVMALLVVAISVTAPVLSHFFHGRALDAEARRLLSLTRAGQSRAVSEGVAALLWIDAPQHEYGLELENASRAGSPGGGIRRGGRLAARRSQRRADFGWSTQIACGPLPAGRDD